MTNFSDPMPVELVPHDLNWAKQAKDEIARLGGALGDNLVVIHHIGSTAIPGIMAKPVIDLLPLVADLDALDAKEGAVTALGYNWAGEFGLPGRRYLRLNRDGRRAFNVHCYQQGNPEITRHLAFRDFVRAHRDVAKDYEAQKIRAAALHPDDVLAYNDAKNDWIKDTERKALAWYAAQPR